MQQQVLLFFCGAFSDIEKGVHKMTTIKILLSMLNILWRGVLMLWDIATAVPLATGAIIVLVAAAVVFLIVGR